MVEIFVILNLIFLSCIKIFVNAKVLPFVIISYLAITASSILDILNYVIFRKENIEVQKKFNKKIDGLASSIYRGLISIITLPNKAWLSLKAICKTIYRMKVTKEHLLEWTTSEEAEKQNKKDLKSMYKLMTPNVVFGILGLALCFYLFTFGLSNVTANVGMAISRLPKVAMAISTIITNMDIYIILLLLLSIFWLIAPLIMWCISMPKENKKAIDTLNKEEQEYTLKIAKSTWGYFLDFMNKGNNYLPPDNFQESRREKIVHRTSSTNIGLGLMTIISSYDLKFITLEKALAMLENMMETIVKLDKWNGHLYNWYNTVSLKPLTPRYISTVDSGNFVRIYVYFKRFLKRKRIYTV